MSKSSLLLSALLLSSCQPTPAIEDESVESLRGVETTRLAALNARDVNAVVEIEGGAVGFGWASTAPRQNEPASSKARLERWFSTMEHFEIELQDDEYKVVGNTGLVIGTLVRREKPIHGSTLTRRLRYSAIYVREGNRWRMLQYHRSSMPVESTPGARP
jgi:ketosteroid isomerase-like protein